MPKSTPKKPKATNRAKKTAARKTPYKKSSAPIFERALENPILSPYPMHSWESKAAFNPAAFYENGKVHLLYRAIGDNDVSVLGYAAADDGERISERYPSPVYFHKPRPDFFALPYPYGSGGGWNGGAEDPRLVSIDNTVYLIYTAFDGWSSIRIALTSISLENFKNKRWTWKKPVLISPPDQIHKNWVMFPEKINGKFAILHSISPSISIDYFDNLDEIDEKNVIKSFYERSFPKGRDAWDDWIRGAGPPPIRTPNGWLLLYHAMDDRDPNKYKIGAMMLDLDSPDRVLYRSSKPILEPKEIYENKGYKPGVVYSCGAVVIGNELFVYYGGADKFTCVAKANLKKFLKDLKDNGRPKLEHIKHPPNA